MISGGSNPDILAHIFPEWSKEKCEEWAAKKEAIFREEATKTGLEPIAGFNDFLTFISNNGKWEYTSKSGETVKIVPVIVTNAPLENVLFMLYNLKFRVGETEYIHSQSNLVQSTIDSTPSNPQPLRESPPFVDVFVVDERGCRGKPHSDPYACAMERHGLNNNQCITFEDSFTGIASAVGAHVESIIGIRSTYTHEQLVEKGAAETVEDWREMGRFGRESVEEWIENVLRLGEIRRKQKEGEKKE